MPKILHIVEPTFDFNKIIPGSSLLTKVDNDLTKDHYHTSIADMSSSDICKVSHLFDCINFVPMHYNLDSNLYKETVILLNYLSHRHCVTNFNSLPTKKFVSNETIFTQNKDPVLWVFGCSHSHGVGLATGEKNFGDILSTELSLPLKLITKPGSSIDWSFNHLINANIQSNDIVIWQLTTPERLSDLHNYNELPNELLLKEADISVVNFYSDTRIFYKQLCFLNSGVNYLRSNKIKFLLTSLDGFSELAYQLRTEYTKHPEYVYLPGFQEDLGYDNIHVGPKSHKNLALGMLNHLQYNYNYVI